MIAVASQRASGVGAHPVWHFAVVAAAGVLVFLGIKLREWQLHHDWRLPRPDPVVLFLALGSADCAAIHGAVCPEHFRESAVFGVFFVAAAAAQAGWAVAMLLRPSRNLLTWAAVGNAAVVVLWLLSRTTGLPLGPTPWKPETIGSADALATVLEALVVAGALWVRSQGGALVSSPQPSTV